jgi:hypothetical protein
VGEPADFREPPDAVIAANVLVQPRSLQAVSLSCAAIFHASRVNVEEIGLEFMTMEPKFAPKYLPFKRVMDHDTRNLHARAIPYGSYTETAAANGLVLIGFAVLAAMVVSLLIRFRIL